MHRLALRSAFLIAVLALSAGPAAGQYSTFGKNKVQYEDFDWEVLSSDHVDLYYYPEERELALIALDYAEESFDVLSERFSYVPRDRIPMVVYASHQHFEQTNIVPFFLPEGVAGFTEFLKGRVALPFNGSYADFRHVIRHELVHVFQARKGAHLKRLHPGGYEWNSPLWFTEGLAEFWSGPWNAEGDLVVRDLLLNRLAHHHLGGRRLGQRRLLGAARQPKCQNPKRPKDGRGHGVSPRSMCLCKSMSVPPA